MLLADTGCSSISLHCNFILCSLRISNGFLVHIFCVFVQNFTLVVKRIRNSICEVNECQPIFFILVPFLFVSASSTGHFLNDIGALQYGEHAWARTKFYSNKSY
jgi:hypothetical protein